MQVPIMDLKAQYATVGTEACKAVENVLKSGHFITGEEGKKLEEEIARYCKARHAVAVNSGTDALFLTLRALGIKEGDEVITSPFSFFATAETISMTGAKPVFTDIRPDTYNIDFMKIKEKITSKTKAIMPVHLYGQPADMDEIMEIAKENNLKVVEDAAQAIGAEYKKKRVCSIGDAGCLSFYPTKNLGGAGDGGMVVTNSDEIAEKVKMLRDHGSKKKYMHSVIGACSRLDEIQAAVLRVKLKYLDVWNERKRKNAKAYNLLLKYVTIPFEQEYVKHVYHQYTVRVAGREKLQKYLKDNGISTAIHYPIPIHLQEVYIKAGYSVSMPESEKAAKEVMSLPNFPEMTDEQLNYVAMTINNFKE